MPDGPRAIAVCCFAILVALLVVGAVSHGVLRHAVQTLPLWVPILVGWRGSELAKWAALPCLVFWLGIVALIWLYLAGLARVVSGTFSGVEIAMTLVVGAACLCGLGVAFLRRTAVRPLTATATVALLAVLQLLAMKISLLPAIAVR